MKRLFMSLLLVSAGSVFGAASSSSSTRAPEVGASSTMVSSGSAEKDCLVSDEISRLESEYRKLSAKVNEDPNDLDCAWSLLDRGIGYMNGGDFYGLADNECSLKFYGAAECNKINEATPFIYLAASTAFFRMGEYEKADYYISAASHAQKAYEKNVQAREEILKTIKRKSKDSDKFFNLFMRLIPGLYKVPVLLDGSDGSAVSASTSEAEDLVTIEMKNIESEYRQLHAEVYEDEDGIDLVNIGLREGICQMDDEDYKGAMSTFFMFLNLFGGKLNEVASKLWCNIAMVSFYMKDSEGGLFYAKLSTYCAKQYRENLQKRKALRKRYETLRIIHDSGKKEELPES